MLGRRHPAGAEPAHREIETTMVVLSNHPEKVVQEIAELDAVGDYLLAPQPSRNIHDVYLDRVDRGLAKKRFVLRIREIDSECLITLKGPPQNTSRGLISRFEMEVPWSPEGLRGILSKLGSEQEIVGVDEDFLKGREPLEVMKSLAFKTIQDRHNYRQIRNVYYPSQKESDAFAEMAIDAVTYHFAGQHVRHYEIEIEATGTGKLDEIVEIRDKLISTFDGKLVAWRYGKLTVGIAIQRMLKDGVLGSLMDGDGNLAPVAYKVMKRHV